VALFGTDPLDELLVPDGTHAEEHDLVTDGDVIVASQSTVEFGVRGGNVIAGERVEFGGDIEAEGDCRLDTWCDVAGNVLVGEDAYLGERAHIGGELRVAGNLDIGDDVQIDEGFEANGWIVIRNPMPTIVFLFIYLSQLLRIGEEDAAEELLSAMTEAGDREHEPVLIPQGSRVGDDAWRVSTPGRVGDDCRLHGNIRAESLVVGRDNELFGSLRAREGITVGAGTEVTGNVTTREGTVRIGPGTTIRGDVAGEFVEVHRKADIEGAIRANEEVSMVSEPVLDDAVVAADDESTASEGTTESTEQAESAETAGPGAETATGETETEEPAPVQTAGNRESTGAESDDNGEPGTDGEGGSTGDSGGSTDGGDGAAGDSDDTADEDGESAGGGGDATDEDGEPAGGDDDTADGEGESADRSEGTDTESQRNESESVADVIPSAPGSQADTE